MAQAILVFPAVAAVAAASNAFFTLLLSERWAASGDIFTLLAGAAAIQTVVAINGSLLQAIGHTGARLRLTVEYAILWTISALATAPFGIEAVALGCTVTTLLYLPRLLHLYLRPIECSPLDFMRALAGPTLTALTLFIGHRSLMRVIDVSLWAEIGIVIVETTIAYALLLFFQRREIMGQLRGVRAMLSPGAAL
jgi:O-antigen/teichoic acid export membrane protein